MPNTLANTDFNTVRCGKKRNLQYTYGDMDTIKMFDDFWDVYPRKEHRLLSENEYVNLFLEKGGIKDG